MQEPTLTEMEGGQMYHYWNCPARFIPTSVHGFLSLYRYCKDFHATMPGPGDVSARFLVAVHYYEGKVAENTRLKMEKRV